MGSLSMLFLLFFSQGQSSTPEVEERSTCGQCDERLFCNCSSRNYRRVPTVTITEVVTLDLSFNDITTVAEDDLREYTQLRTLDLRSNRIQSIHEWAFHLLQEINNDDEMVIIIRSLTRLRFLRFGNPALEEVRRGDLAGVIQLDQLEV
ncbi:hypothetical protein J4Q44_G00053220 [Coregonus suidteri]|uniref:Uncharacterized protein n=1 Tax=Coregonus suidteri TaxID=861788 RepID=A0AAN8R494_9TELE